MHKYAGFDTPLAAVLSGEFELCVPRLPIERASDPLPGPDMARAFIRDASFKLEGPLPPEDDEDCPIPRSLFTKTTEFPVLANEAAETIKHKCVKLGMRGSLFHYYTRRWPVPHGGK